MQAIWSRVAQGASSGCRACGRGSNIFTRRTATTGPLRSKVGFADIFTALYTTILGAAAVTDAKCKDDQTLEIDRQIAEAKAELAQLLERAPRSDPLYEERRALEREARRNRALGDHLSKICICPGRLRRLGRIATVRRQLVTNELRDSPVVGRSMRSSSSLTPNYDAILQRILQDEKDPLHPNRECKTDGQLEAARQETLLLAENLLAAVCKIDDSTNSASQEDQEKQAERVGAILGDISQIREEKYPQFKFALLLPHETHEARTTLGQATRQILGNSGRDGPYETVAKISYNMLVSPFPPSIHDYNTLIFGFTRIGWYDLAGTVADSLGRTKLAQTQQTMSCLLHLYRLKNDIISFYTVIARLVAVLPTGPMIRRKHRRDMGFKALALWAAYGDVVAHRFYVTARMPRDASIFEAMIYGTLHFGQMEHAIHILSNALYQGCRISFGCVQGLLDACLASVDQEAAMSLIRLFTNNLKGIKAMGILDMKTISAKMYAIFSLVGMRPCIVQAPQVLRAINIHPTGFELLSLSLFVNEVKRRIARLEMITFKLMKIFTLLPSKLVPSLSRGSSFDRIAHVYARRFDSQAGEWCEHEYQPFRKSIALLEHIHKASQTTFQLITEFQYILPRLPEIGKTRRQAYGLVYRHDPIGLLYSKTAIQECLNMVRQKPIPEPAVVPVDNDIYEEESLIAAGGAC